MLGEPMLKRKRINNKIVAPFVALLVVMVIGVSYAFLMYGKAGLYTYDITGGQMGVIYNETTGNNITINNSYPMTDEEALDKALEFEFKVTGYNESEKDVYYAIEMDHGNDVANKIRFKDSDVKLTLYENDVLVLANAKYDNLDNKEIYYGYFDAGTSEDNPITNTYKLRIWINDDVFITDTPNKFDVTDKSVYTPADFANGYANFKVNIKADLSYKTNEQPASCFAYSPVFDSDAMYYDGTYYDLNTSSEAVAICKDWLLNTYFNGEDISDAGDGYQTFCEGTGTINGDSLKYGISNNYFTSTDLEYLITNNVLMEISEPEISGIEITDYDVSTCGTSVWIPEYIEGYPVTRIADAEGISGASNTIYDIGGTKLNHNNYNYAIESIEFVGFNNSFREKGITSVHFPKFLEYIGDDSFHRNELTTVYFPENVKVIGNGAFWGNNLTSVHFPESLRYIDQYAFGNNNLSNLIIPSGVTTIEWNAFDENPLVNVEVKGASYLGGYSFRPSSYNFETFKYGGTCEQLNNEYHIFGNYDEQQPKKIITSDNNACVYDHYGEIN